MMLDPRAEDLVWSFVRHVSADLSAGTDNSDFTACKDLLDPC